MDPDILVLGTAPEAARATARLLAGHGLDAVAQAPAGRRAAGIAGWAALVAGARPRVLVLDVPAAGGLPAARLRALLARLRREAPARGAAPAVVVRMARPGGEELRAPPRCTTERALKTRTDSTIDRGQLGEQVRSGS
jgi:hypothetical protein